MEAAAGIGRRAGGRRQEARGRQEGDRREEVVGVRRPEPAEAGSTGGRAAPDSGRGVPELCRAFVVCVGLVEDVDTQHNWRP